MQKNGKKLKFSLLGFIGLSFLTLIVFIWEVLLQRPVAQKLLSPLGLITAALAMPLVKRGVEDIKDRRFTLESFLGLSIVIAVAAGEAVAALEILWITGGGSLLQAWITERSRKSIRNILQITEKNTYILVDTVEVEVPVESVKPGDTVVLHTGEKISVDGKILRGRALVDEASITGHSEPVLRETDEKVFAGTFVSFNGNKCGFKRCCKKKYFDQRRKVSGAAKADIVCFDKTGTLTTNEPEITHLAVLNEMSEEELIQLAYSAEVHNSHPVALAIKTEAKKRGIKPVSHDVCDYIPGIGIRCEISVHEILVGSGKLMNKFSVAPVEVKKQLEKMKKLGLTMVFIAKDSELEGIIGFANHQRPGVDSVLQYLTNDGVNEITMVTGDSKYTALDLAERLNIAKCYYSVMPEEKADIIRELRNNGSKVLMVGDGINDALALAEADIGIAMGTGGSEVAIEAADIALVGDDIKGVVYVRSLSHATIRVVHQNFWIATGSNIAGVILGALGILSPVMAGLIHITHTVGILANSGRLLFYEEPPL